MLSVFPELFAFQQLGPFILRISLAIILVLYFYARFFKSSGNYEKIAGIIQGISGVFLFAGFLIQPSALVVMIVALTDNARTKFKKESSNYKRLEFLIFTIAFALLFLGPGLFAIDIPL